MLCYALNVFKHVLSLYETIIIKLNSFHQLDSDIWKSTCKLKIYKEVKTRIDIKLLLREDYEQIQCLRNSRH